MTEVAPWRLEVVVGSVEAPYTAEAPFITIKFLSFPAISITAAAKELNPPSTRKGRLAARRMKYNAGKAMVFSLAKEDIVAELARSPLFLMVCF